MIKELEKVIPLNAMKWNEIVLNSHIPVLVDFWADWCGPCRMVGPTRAISSISGRESKSVQT